VGITGKVLCVNIWTNLKIQSYNVMTSTIIIVHVSICT